jgi:hypothetical protein
MIISKAAGVYLVMVVVLVGGLWVILAVGSTLTPPTDVAGTWDLSGTDGTRKLTVEQSGRFVDIATDGLTASLKITQDTNLGSSKNPVVIASNQKERLTFDNLINDRCSIRFDGTLQGIYQAHRAHRAFN